MEDFSTTLEMTIKDNNKQEYEYRTKNNKRKSIIR